MSAPGKSVVCIVTPGTRTANNGNWRTAARWAAMLRDRYRVIVQSAWRDEPADAMIALHARRSADSIAAFRERHPRKPLAVMLTGTDLYRDLPDSEEAARSLDAAWRIVALQEDAPRLLPEKWRAKCVVIFQSARSLDSAPKPTGRMDAIVVGHLREEKDPRTLFEAVSRLPPELPIHIRHVGAPLDAGLAAEARALQSAHPRYRFAGPLPHGLTRAAIKSAHVLVHPSIMEGGANVVVEAVTSGTPVIASRISGNIGMLGPGYPGYFEARDASGLALQLVKAVEDVAHLVALQAACEARRALFEPQRERASVHELVAGMLAQRDW